MEKRGILYLAEDEAQVGMGLVLRIMQLVQLFQTPQGMLVNRVVVVKVVLDEQVDAPEFRQIAREKAHLVHQSQDVADAPAPPQKLEKSVRGLSRSAEFPVDGL